MYIVEIDEQSEAQICALPGEALGAFAEARTMLEVCPWGGRPYVRSNPDGSMRTLPFGKSGLVIYMILEDQRRVDVLKVMWIG